MAEVQEGQTVQPSARKIRHNKVYTAKGPRDRRVRLSADTAFQFYDVQDRLGCERASEAVDWLIQKAKGSIDKLFETSSQQFEQLTFQGVQNNLHSHYNAANMLEKEDSEEPINNNSQYRLQNFSNNSLVLPHLHMGLCPQEMHYRVSHENFNIGYSCAPPSVSSSIQEFSTMLSCREITEKGLIQKMITSNQKSASTSVEHQSMSDYEPSLLQPRVLCQSNASYSSSQDDVWPENLSPLPNYCTSANGDSEQWTIF